MPRQARIDFPGLLHHIIARGIERRPIFSCKDDYTDFLDRIEPSTARVPTQILAWALMPNHFHLLVRSGPQGMVPFMRRLMTGYAGAFNRRYRRAGHLFQNRYKSIICDENAYLLELVRYIHLNPVRAKLVRGMEDLARYPYTGHSVLMGNAKAAWQETEEILGHFSKTLDQARSKYEEFVALGLGQGKRVDLIGGGLGRSLGGGPREVPLGMRGDRQLFDSRVLGEGEFVQRVLETVQKTEELQATLIYQKVDIYSVAEKVAKKYDIDVRLIFARNRMKRVSQAKALMAFLGTEHLRQSNTEMARLLKMTPTAAGRARFRGLSLADSFDIDPLIQVS
ncbi:MAG: transposase [Elusimicrobia bacterium]|nr:transposase [Elusimicrobiota bacterium]